MVPPPGASTGPDGSEPRHQVPATALDESFQGPVTRTAARRVPSRHRLRRVAFREGIARRAGALSYLLLAHPRHRDVFVKDFGFMKT